MGLFPPGKGGGEGVKYGHKGSCILIHTLTDGNGMPLANCTTPANGSERDRVIPLLGGIRPQWPKRVWKSQKNRGRPIKISVPRFQQERCFAWFQRKYRRLVVRWERISDCFNGFLPLATIHIWINRILLVG